MRRLSILIFVMMLPAVNLRAALERPNFDSYEEAVAWVRSNDNFTKDSVDTSKSTWIRAAEYYTDGSGYGFLILNMNGKEYIWEDVPIDIWTGFKKADSFGKYYHRYIKGNYYMELGK